MQVPTWKSQRIQFWKKFKSKIDPLRVVSHNHNNPFRGQHFIAVACFQKTAHSLVACDSENSCSVTSFSSLKKGNSSLLTSDFCISANRVTGQTERRRALPTVYCLSMIFSVFCRQSRQTNHNYPGIVSFWKKKLFVTLSSKTQSRHLHRHASDHVQLLGKQNMIHCSWYDWDIFS